MKTQQNLGWVRWNPKGATMSLFTQEIRISHTLWTHWLLQVSTPIPDGSLLPLAKGIPCLILHCFRNTLFIFALTFGRGSGSPFNVMAPTWEEINYFSLISKSPTEHIVQYLIGNENLVQRGVLSHPPDCAVHTECVRSSIGDLGPDTHSLPRESSREDLEDSSYLGKTLLRGMGFAQALQACPPSMSWFYTTGWPIWTAPSHRRPGWLSSSGSHLLFSCYCYLVPKSWFSFSYIKLNAKQPLTSMLESLPHLAHYKVSY